MKNVLFTGVTGFIGKKLLDYIEERKLLVDCKIILLSSVEVKGYETVLHNNYSFSKEDFLEKGITHIDCLIHLGAFIPKQNNQANSILKNNENVFNTQYLLEHLPSVPHRVIFISSIDVYKPSPEHLSEASTVHPQTLYGWSKLYCEKMLESWAAENPGVILQVLRLGHVYGPGEEQYKKVIPVTIKRLKEGLAPKIFGTGKEKRSFINIQDVCRLIMRSLALESYEGPINLCSATACSIKDVIKMLASFSDLKAEVESVPSVVQTYDSCFDVSKMHKLLGEENVSLRDGLKLEYESFPG